MNYAYARVSAKDRTYSGRLPRLVSNGAKLRYAPRERAPRALFSLPRPHLTDDPRSPRVILHNYTICLPLYQLFRTFSPLLLAHFYGGLANLSFRPLDLTQVKETLKACC